MAHSDKAYDDRVLYDVSTGGNLLWDLAKFGAKVVGRNLVGSDKSPRLEGPGSPEQLLTPVERKRGEPPFKSLIRETSTRSTSTSGQKARLAAAARTGKVQAQRGVSARRNAADISMNNPPVVTDASGHRVYNGRRVHK